MPQQEGCRKQVLEIRQFNPCVSYSDIGRMTGVTRERVRQICGNRKSRKSEFRRISNRVTLVCPNCGTIFSRKNHYIKQLKARGTKIFYCSVKCSAKHSFESVVPNSMEIFGTLARNLEILIAYESGESSQVALGKKYNLTQSRISLIIKRMKEGK